MMSKIVSVLAFIFVLPIIAMQQPADYGHNQLLKAILAQDDNAVAALLKSGVNPNFYRNPDKSDFALTQAVRNANPVIVQLLLESSADPSIDPNILCTSYMAGPGKLEDPLAFNDRRLKVMQLLINDPRTNLNCIDSEGNTVLMKAFKTRFNKLIKLLLSEIERLDMTIKNKEGLAVHHYATTKPLKQTLQEAEARLLPARKVPEKMAGGRNISKEYLKKLPGYSETTFMGEPVKVAQSQPVVLVLDPRVELYNAIATQNIPAVIKILNTRLNPNASITATNLSPLMVAASINSVPVMKILLHTQFIDPNKKNRDGDTALIIATRAGAVEAVAELLEHQEIIDNINLENNKGLTAFDEANEKQYGHWIKIGQMLSAKKASIGSSAERKPISRPQEDRPTIPDAAYGRLAPTLNSASTPQEIIGFKTVDNPTQDQIRKAYRALSLKWHPDRNPGDLEAAEIFKIISWAYGELTKGQ